MYIIFIFNEQYAGNEVSKNGDGVMGEENVKQCRE
jgi:hypothetical protein